VRTDAAGVIEVVAGGWHPLEKTFVEMRLGQAFWHRG
jgi:hypothetical protein